MADLHWLILALVALLLLAGYGRFHARLKIEPRRFFDGMNAATTAALAGAMLLAVSLLIDVYGPDWASPAMSDDLSLALAGSGGLLVLLSLVLDRRSRKRRS